MLDYETTGTDPHTCRPVSVSFALTLPDRTTVLGSYHAIINPGCEVPAEAVAVHGITTEMARGLGVPAHQAIVQVLARLHACKALGWPVLIYNAMYDWQLLHAEAARLSPIAHHLVDFRIPDVVLIDPLVIDRHFGRYRKGGHKLEAAARHYGVWREGAHDAFVDACMTADVLRAQMRRHPELQQIPLGPELMEWQAEAHAAWVASMNDFWARQGKQDRIADTRWPGVAPAGGAPCRRARPKDREALRPVGQDVLGVGERVRGPNANAGEP